MADINSQNFEPFESTQGKHSILEADIERLSREILEKRSAPEYRDFSDKELLDNVIKPITKSDGDNKNLIDEIDKSDSAEKSFLPDYLKNSSSETKLEVEKLIDSVFHQGLAKAVNEAKNSNPAILDAFHDALVDKLYDELKKRNLL
ncbi:MAG: hypothetical protein AAB596_02950 [Patescibacteria group bacterium]